MPIFSTVGMSLEEFNKPIVYSIVDVSVGRLAHGCASQYQTRGSLRWHDCLVIAGIVS